MAAELADSYIPMLWWNSPDLTFSGNGTMPRAEAPTGHACFPAGTASFSPFLALMIVWQCRSGVSTTTYPSGISWPFFIRVTATGSVLQTEDINHFTGKLSVIGHS